MKGRKKPVNKCRVSEVTANLNEVWICGLPCLLPVTCINPHFLFFCLVLLCTAVLGFFFLIDVSLPFDVCVYSLSSSDVYIYSLSSSHTAQIACAVPEVGLNGRLPRSGLWAVDCPSRSWLASCLCDLCFLHALTRPWSSALLPCFADDSGAGLTLLLI